MPDGPARDVRFEIADGRFTAVAPGAPVGDATRLPGVVLPGFANAHSHAFHRALRGRTHAGGGTFWTWRERMYELAARLDPDSYLALATAVYAEMALTGVSAVGEFHYLHHAPGGAPYADPNAMGEALREAARAAGIRLTLLDTCYLAGGLDADGYRPLDQVQRRFADADVDAWSARVDALRDDAATRIGTAIHSVRAVPRAVLGAVARPGRPLHVHLSEQPAENAAALAHYGVTPTALLAGAGVLGPDTTAVHATHLTADDVAELGRTRTTACFCPTTERDLADGIGPARELATAGAPLSLGSDQHAVLDLFEEARGLESHERLRSNERGRFTPDELLAALTRHDSLGWPDAGTLAPGARADLVAVRLDSVRTAGAEPPQVLYAAGAPDVDTVVVDGRVVVRDGQHVLGDVGRLLSDAIGALWPS
ncbi:MAG: formimidoylglutamate deiminase [Actinobacteria bacterium]|nr:formimidoylglutamate deiminase [Actinomycetota bacterium]